MCATTLITGVAGFIGFHVARRLLAQGRTVVGIDNLNSYYDPALKDARLKELAPFKNFEFIKLDISDHAEMAALFSKHKFPKVIHLAAQPGVRYSLTNPHAYIDANITGFMNILEGCRHTNCRHLLYASSSSVYGANTQMPFTAEQNVDHPISLYGATKKANELMAHAYAHLFGIPATGLRFFTVYGPWGRPDMAVWQFTSAISEGRPIKLFNNGNMKRDFTYIDDVAEAVVRLVDHPAAANPHWAADCPDPASSNAPWRVYNIGNYSPEEVNELVRLIEQAVGKPAKREFLPMQPGDVLATYADVAPLNEAIGFTPKTPLNDGIQSFVEWYRRYYSI